MDVVSLRPAHCRCIVQSAVCIVTWGRLLLAHIRTTCARRQCMPPVNTASDAARMKSHTAARGSHCAWLLLSVHQPQDDDAPLFLARLLQQTPNHVSAQVCVCARMCVCPACLRSVYAFRRPQRRAMGATPTVPAVRQPSGRRAQAPSLNSPAHSARIAVALVTFARKQSLTMRWTRVSPLAKYRRGP